jgi:DNA-binding response OmpR family regulator
MQDPINILIVDDEDYVRTPLQSLLTEVGYAVDAASDGDEAIACISKKAFDLVLLDITMKRVDGLDVLKFIKKDFPALKVIMLTAFANLNNAEASKRLGADDFMSKPYNPEELIATIEKVLGE